MPSTQHNLQPYPSGDAINMHGHLRMHGPQDEQREETECFIRQVFRRHYGAEVTQFAPVLVSLRDDDGTLVAAAGYRDAATAPLFLERYLDTPVDRLLASPSTTMSRDHIVEVGHLAATRPGAGKRLIFLLGPYLAAQGYRWVVSTLTEELRQVFLRLGIVPLSLGVADPALLGDDAGAWGNYYDHRPVVLAGQLDIALKALARQGLSLQHPAGGASA